MKKIIVALTVVVASLIVAPAMASDNNTDKFYFSDFAADYYLSRDEEGISHLKVVENLTAEFPVYAQNKGLRRYIPFTNQDGLNVTLPNLDNSNITIKRNGVDEPIWNIERNGDYYAVETGTDEYVLGTQKYTFEYTFDKVVTDFDDYQELYWDTNGTGWPQSFQELKARVHFDANLLDDFDDNEAWCYVGKYGDSDQSRCKVTPIYDGFEFVTHHVRPYENLSFVVKIKPETFVVPKPEGKNTLIIITMVLGIVCAVLVTIRIVKTHKYFKRIKAYKAMFVAPQYQPDKKYSLIETAEVYLGKKKDVKVGVLLGMLVEKKVELRKANGSSKWELIVKNSENLKSEEELVLRLLKGGGVITNEEVIELKSRIATTELIGIGKEFDAKVLSSIRKSKLVDEKYVLGNASSLGVVSGLFANTFTSAIMTLVLTMPILYFYEIMRSRAIDSVAYLVGHNECIYVTIGILFVTCFVFFWTSSRKKIIANITDEGLKASNYMEGLKLYMEMAEKDRMKVLQSVKGAEVSDKGIVKLYEKLLPYAAVFGIEESWMNEMKEYCEVNEITEPDYLLTGITAYELSRSMRSAATIASNSGHSIAGGGSFSSSSSGSGGGGFSGGGGGGGGGGGR